MNEERSALVSASFSCLSLTGLHPSQIAGFPLSRIPPAVVSYELWMLEKRIEDEL